MLVFESIINVLMFLYETATYNIRFMLCIINNYSSTVKDVLVRWLRLRYYEPQVTGSDLPPFFVRYTAFVAQEKKNSSTANIVGYYIVVCKYIYVSIQMLQEMYKQKRRSTTQCISTHICFNSNILQLLIIPKLYQFLWVFF